LIRDRVIGWPVARVVPDGDGERQQALGDPGGDPGQAAAAVQLQIQLALGGVVDRLDQLADRGQQRLAGTGGAVAVGRAQQCRAAVGQVAVEFGGGVALVGDDQQPWPGGEQMPVAVEHGHQHLALVELGMRQRPGDRQPGRGADQVQPQPPEVAGVGAQ
jgi:hypothetical protein